MKNILRIILGFAFVLAVTSGVFAADKKLFGFEKDVEGWEIPDWAFEKEDHVAESISVSNQYALEGKSSLEVKVDFPGGKWTAAYLEIVEFFDWTPFSQIYADLYLPSDAPAGLKAKFILTVGEGWEWTEMSRSKALEPGKWVTMSANLKPGSTDWRIAAITDAFRQDVRKLGIRIESNMKPAYKGSVYIDNIWLTE
jgi:hypothetical protein